MILRTISKTKFSTFGTFNTYTKNLNHAFYTVRLNQKFRYQIFTLSYKV